MKGYLVYSQDFDNDLHINHKYYLSKRLAIHECDKRLLNSNEYLNQNPTFLETDFKISKKKSYSKDPYIYKIVISGTKYASGFFTVSRFAIESIRLSPEINNYIETRFQLSNTDYFGVTSVTSFLNNKRLIKTIALKKIQNLIKENYPKHVENLGFDIKKFNFNEDEIYYKYIKE